MTRYYDPDKPRKVESILPEMIKNRAVEDTSVIFVVVVVFLLVLCGAITAFIFPTNAWGQILCFYIPTLLGISVTVLVINSFMNKYVSYLPGRFGFDSQTIFLQFAGEKAADGSTPEDLFQIDGLPMKIIPWARVTQVRLGSWSGDLYLSTRDTINEINLAMDLEVYHEFLRMAKRHNRKITGEAVPEEFREDRDVLFVQEMTR